MMPDPALGLPSPREGPAPAPAPAHRGGPPVGLLSLKQMVDAAVADAEERAIRRALQAARGNKSKAARLLRTNFTTLHHKMRRYAISAREFVVGGDGV